MKRASRGSLDRERIAVVQPLQGITEREGWADRIAGREGAYRGLSNAAVIGQKLLCPPSPSKVVEQLVPVHRRALKHRSVDIMANGFSIVNIGTLIGMARNRSEFGARMLKAREGAGLTQQAVRDALGVAQSTLSHLETGAKGSARTIEFARLYAVRPEWLSSGTGEMKPADESDPRAAMVVADMLNKAPKEDRDIWFATILRDIHRNPDAYAPEDRARFEAALLAITGSGGASH